MKMDEYTFKHCPKGHYYQGEECPYCKAQTTPFGINSSDQAERYDMNVCPNGHAYYKDSCCCPYCGEKRVAERVIETSIIPLEISIKLKHKVPIKVDGRLIELSSLNIFYRHFRGGVSYTTNLDEFDYKSKIEIGYIELTGKQLTGIIDSLIINNVKDFKISE